MYENMKTVGDELLDYLDSVGMIKGVNPQMAEATATDVYFRTANLAALRNIASDLSAIREHLDVAAKAKVVVDFKP